MNEIDTIIMKEPLLHRRLDQSQVLAMVFYIVFAVIVLCQICTLSLSSRMQRQREMEQQRQMTQNKTKMEQTRRQHLIKVFKDKALARVLTASNFKLVPMEKLDDIEQGNNLATNISFDDRDDSKSTSAFPQSQDEMITRSSDNIHTRCSMMKSQEHVGTTCQGSALQSIDEEAMDDALAAELGEVQFIRNETLMSIPILCSICLENYKEGDTVIVSSNVSCTHGFHLECVLDYLVQHEGQSFPCPCCRQVFLSTETMNEASTTANMASVSQDQDTGSPTQ